MADELKPPTYYTPPTAASMVPVCSCCLLLFVPLLHTAFCPIRVSAAASIQTTRPLAFPYERLPHSQSSTHT